MDFALDDIQQMLQDSASKFIQNDYGFEKRQKLVKSELGYSEENWQLFAELGWLALPFSEELGGMDGGASDLMVLHTQLGKGLVVEPYLPSVVLAGKVIDRHADEEQKAPILEALLGGELKMALAVDEPGAQNQLARIATKAEKTADGYLLTGHKAVVLGAPSADKLVVVARTAGESGNTEGLSLFLVNADQEGVKLHSYPTNDGGRAADIQFEQVKLGADQLLGEADTAFPAIEATMNTALVALSAEAVGIMEKLLDATVEYCKVRKQFGQPIGNFQVLQHRMAEMFMECEQAKSMLYYAAITVDAGRESAGHAASLLKVKIGSAGRFVGQQAIQLHGGMGVTDELDVGHYFKRLTMINTLFGSHDEHLNRLVSQAQAT